MSVRNIRESLDLVLKIGIDTGRETLCDADRMKGIKPVSSDFSEELLFATKQIDANSKYIIFDAIEQGGELMANNEGNYGKYGLMRLKFLKEHRSTQYIAMLNSGNLSAHLLDVNERASAEVEQLVDSFVKRTVLPDKSSFPEEWAQKMNALKHRAEEIVSSKLIYV